MPPLASPLAGRPPVAAPAVHPVWTEIAPELVPSDFRNPYDMDVEFLRLLSAIRREAEVPMRIISDARDPDGNVGATFSAHKKRPCRAVDIRVHNSYERARIIIAAVRHGVVRFGIYPGKEKDRGSVHIDAETHPENPSPRIWTRY